MTVWWWWRIDGNHTKEWSSERDTEKEKERATLERTLLVQILLKNQENAREICYGRDKYGSIRLRKKTSGMNQVVKGCDNAGLHWCW